MYKYTQHCYTVCIVMPQCMYVGLRHTAFIVSVSVIICSSHFSTTTENYMLKISEFSPAKIHFPHSRLLISLTSIVSATVHPQFKSLFIQILI